MANAGMGFVNTAPLDATAPAAAADPTIHFWTKDLRLDTDEDGNADEDVFG